MDPMVAMYIAQVIHGLAYGMLLFLVSSGLTLVFGMMSILNLAHASFYMFGAYLGYTVLKFTGNFWATLTVAPLIAAFFGCLSERCLLRKVHAQGHVAELILTLGISMLILESVKIFWGTESLIVNVPHLLKGLVNLGGLPYPLYRLFVIGLSLVVFVILFLLLYKTRLGMIVRAAVADADMVSALGVNVPLVFLLVFGLGTWLAGLAGVVAAPLLSVYPGMADQMALDAFIVVIVGGLGSLWGAFIVSICLGELSALGIQFIPRMAPVLMFAFMALVLAFKPKGFFGERE